MRHLAFAFTLLATSAAAQDGSAISGIDLVPSRGAEIGAVFEAWLSPQQEGGEEQDTPGIIPQTFRSTTPSVDRNDRTSRGHGTLSFSRDLSRAYAHVRIENVNPDEINMFHIHCGRPGQLGPIIVDLGMELDLSEEFADGEILVEITNEDIVAVIERAQGLVSAFTAGCPIVPTIPTDRVVTVAGMAHIAFVRELYFNLHTTGQTYFGDIRGQLYPTEHGNEKTKHPLDSGQDTDEILNDSYWLLYRTVEISL
ncbi:MAG: CHRD domain-containing protein [Pseudomonadota bacterium]